MNVAKERLDVILVNQGLFESREQAKRAIMAGIVFVEQERVDKPGTKISTDATVTVTERLHPYVSRGGLKLEGSIKRFQLDLQGRIVIDIGASTGGFTDCALQNGALSVYAIDVGYGQLAWKLRQHPQVIVMERTNFRHMKPEDLQGPTPNFATIDVSFISLSHILPPLYRMLQADGEVVALIKPQFEAGRDAVGKKGIVRDPATHRDVLTKVTRMAMEIGYDVLGLAPSPIRGGEGNVEFLAYLKKGLAPTGEAPLLSHWIEQVILEAHEGKE
ncbi:TlyA family RNA methyltransferase [Mechercharimyces sp. CAU 1602]|uniref:TlyA family RNA methyltransferase n=1 Tax=Mechercharimyces sp. CAU 1602 TaxID=2973933 RepID=UPI002161FA0A|nr:TlyA family RNA methyltransferase [Mechercharimyces sp. CAU 1602]MCS1350791.1 TlyA family RNA methyltransferase [Mechercharimyces sp. CAU 1602]